MKKILTQPTIFIPSPLYSFKIQFDSNITSECSILPYKKFQCNQGVESREACAELPNLKVFIERSGAILVSKRFDDSFKGFYYHNAFLYFHEDFRLRSTFGDIIE